MPLQDISLQEDSFVNDYITCVNTSKKNVKFSENGENNGGKMIGSIHMPTREEVPEEAGRQIRSDRGQQASTFFLQPKERVASLLFQPNSNFSFVWHPICPI